MADQAALRSQIRELRERLRRMEEEQDQTRRRLEAQRQADRAELERQLQQALGRADAAAQRQVRQVQEELSAQLRRQTEELRQAGRRAQEERRQALEELRQVNQALRQELEDLRRQEKERTQAGEDLARQRLQEAQSQVQAVEALPHAFFCPGQLDLFREHLSAAQTMLRSGLCAASAAAADAALAELEILELRVREHQREWEEVYSLYRALAAGLWETVEQFEREALETACGRFTMDEGDWDYWSQGSYPSVRREVREAWALVQRVEEAGGAAAYLRSGGALRGFAFQRQVSGLYRLSDRLTAAVTCIRQERRFSDQRYWLAGQAQALLEPLGYRTVSAGFRGTDREEPLDCYDWTGSVNGTDLLRLTFVPRRQDGVAVENLCLLSQEVRTLPSGALLQRQAEGALSRLRQGLPQLAARWIPEPGRLLAEEQSCKQRPDAALLVRRLERKHPN